MRKHESAVRICSEVIKGSGEDPFWEQKIKMMLYSLIFLKARVI